MNFKGCKDLVLYYSNIKYIRIIKINNHIKYYTMSFQQFVCLSGLPRTGSTLLSAILSQNPKIHAEGNSAVSPLMWEMCQSVTNCREQLQANNKEHLVQQLIAQIPHVYYHGIQESIVVDKCRSWTIETNLQLARICIDPNIKVIVLERPLLEIVASFAKLYRNNGFSGEELEAKLLKLLEPDSEPIMRSLQGIQWAKKQTHTVSDLRSFKIGGFQPPYQKDSATFLFVQYHDLVTNPADTMAQIYAFCEWTRFEHDFKHVHAKYPENDAVYGLLGQHDVRSVVAKNTDDSYETILSKDIILKCQQIDRITHL